MHDYHEMQPGYSAQQVLHDGCGECEQRSQSRDRGIAHLDAQAFSRAWQRAYAWNTTGLADVAVVEAPLLSALWSVQIQLERQGIPIGELPGGAS